MYVPRGNDLTERWTPEALCRLIEERPETAGLIQRALPRYAQQKIEEGLDEMEQQESSRPKTKSRFETNSDIFNDESEGMLDRYGRS